MLSPAMASIRPLLRELPSQCGRSMRDFFAIEVGADGDDAHPRGDYSPIE